MKLDDLTKKVFPAQARERLQWQLDAIRANQADVYGILFCLDCHDMGGHRQAKKILNKMHKHDRDAILQSGGILTDEQIEVLKG